MVVRFSAGGTELVKAKRIRLIQSEINSKVARPGPGLFYSSVTLETCPITRTSNRTSLRLAAVVGVMKPWFSHRLGIVTGRNLLQ